MPHSNDDSADSLLAVVTRYRLTLPNARAGYDNLPWRFGGNRKGSLPSFDMPVTLLCTNGVVAWFLRGDGSTFWGHLAAFALDKGQPGVPAFWKVKGDRRTSREDKKKKRIEELMLDL